MLNSSFFWLAWISGACASFLCSLGAFDGSFEFENSIQGFVRIYTGALLGHLLFWLVCTKLGNDSEMGRAKKFVLLMASSVGIFSFYLSVFLLYALEGIVPAILPMFLFFTIPLIVQLAARL